MGGGRVSSRHLASWGLGAGAKGRLTPPPLFPATLLISTTVCVS